MTKPANNVSEVVANTKQGELGKQSHQHKPRRRVKNSDWGLIYTQMNLHDNQHEALVVKCARLFSSQQLINSAKNRQ